MSPDSFDRHARKWSDRKLIEQGLNPFERQRRAREGKLWVEKETELGVLMAKLPHPQFEHLPKRSTAITCIFYGRTAPMVEILMRCVPPSNVWPMCWSSWQRTVMR